MQETNAASVPADDPGGIVRADADAYRLGREVASGPPFRVGLGVLLGGLCLLVWASVATVGELSRANARSLEAAGAMREVTELAGHVARLEAGFRGYALTGGLRHQRDWVQAELAARESLAALSELPGRSPERERHQDLADSLFAAWTALQAEAGILLPATPENRERLTAWVAEEARSLDRSRVRTEIARHLDTIRQMEATLLEESSTQAQSLERRTIALAVIGAAFVALSTIVLSVLLLQRTGRLALVNQMLEREAVERGAAEAALERLGRRHRLILDSAADGILELNAAGTVTFLNPAALRLLKIRGQHAAGLPFRDILFGGVAKARGVADEATATMESIEAALRDGAVHEDADGTFTPKDAPPLPVEVLVAPIRHRGDVTGAVLTFRDATQRREVARMKSEFVSMVSHELRTPLTSIRGSLGLLASGKLGTLTEAGDRMLDIAVQNTDRLVRLIADILDVERIEAGRFVPDRVPTHVKSIVADAALAIQGAAERADIRIDVEADDLTVLADHDRTVQALTNLLDNALKFSPAGSRVRVRARRDGGAARFSVEDWGRGIAPENLEVIFERFRQIDSSDARRKGGSGLGLAIARGIVQQQGGRIWAESAPGRGSTFHFTLPLAATRSEPTLAEATGGGRT